MINNESTTYLVNFILRIKVVQLSGYFVFLSLTNILFFRIVFFDTALQVRQ